MKKQKMVSVLLALSLGVCTPLGVCAEESVPAATEICEETEVETAETESAEEEETTEAVTEEIVEETQSPETEVESVVEETETTYDGAQVLASATIENITWSIDSEGVLRISGKGDMPYLGADDNYWRAKEEWYEYVRNLKKVVIEEGITSISPQAFQMLPASEYVFPSTLKRLEQESMQTVIGDMIVFNEGLEKIKFDAFTNSSVKKIYIPSTVTSLERPVGHDCPRFEGYEVSPDNPKYKSVDGVVYTKDGTTLVAVPVNMRKIDIPSTVTKVVDGAFSECSNIVISYHGTKEDWDRLEIIPLEGYDQLIGILPDDNNSWRHAQVLYIDDFKDEMKANVSAYVNRLYENILGRSADEAGKTTWTKALLDGEMTGCQVADGFMESMELKNKGLSDADFVDVMYATYLNRKPDPDGKAFWENMLKQGNTRRFVFKGFAESVEFTNICNSFHIQRGEVALKASEYNIGITNFVTRCYDTALGRTPDPLGLETWAGVLVNHKETPKQVAHGFIFSKEMNDKNLSDTDYVKTLYRVFLGRTYDEPGLQSWVKLLNEGTSREDVFNGFADSDEFAEIVKSFGL